MDGAEKKGRLIPARKKLAIGSNGAVQREEDFTISHSTVCRLVIVPILKRILQD